MFDQIYDRKTNKIKTVERKLEEFGESLTDKSKYRPNVTEIVGAESVEINPNNYDFADGKDTGERYYTLRNKGADIVEIDNYVKKEIAKGKEELENFAETEKAEILKEMNKTEQKTEQKTE